MYSSLLMVYYYNLKVVVVQSLSHVWLFATAWAARIPCASPSPRACSNSCPLSQWCHPNITSSVISFSSCLQSFWASGSFQWVGFSHQVAKVGASASASVFSVNIQGLISLKSKGLSRVFSSSTVQKHQFLVLCLLYGPYYSLGRTQDSLWVPPYCELETHPMQ